MAPAVDQLIQEYPGSVFKYDAEREIELRTRYNIQAIPTIVLVNENSEEIARKLGTMPKSALESFLLG